MASKHFCPLSGLVWHTAQPFATPTNAIYPGFQSYGMAKANLTSKQPAYAIAAILTHLGYTKGNKVTAWVSDNTLPEFKDTEIDFIRSLSKREKHQPQWCGEIHKLPTYINTLAGKTKTDTPQREVIHVRANSSLSKIDPVADLIYRLEKNPKSAKLAKLVKAYPVLDVTTKSKIRHALLLKNYDPAVSELIKRDQAVQRVFDDIDSAFNDLTL